MLKGKKWTYILLPVTVLIWGLVGYSIYDGLKDDGLDELASTNAPPPAVISGDADTFQLFNNYRDPFLSNLHKSSQPSISTKRDNTPKLPNKGAAIAKAAAPLTNDWPVVQYAGIMKNQSSSTALVLLNISGKVYTLKQGDVAEGLKLLAVSNTEVVLARGKEKRSFGK
jgi:hypothetical protein